MQGCTKDVSLGPDIYGESGRLIAELMHSDKLLPHLIKAAVDKNMHILCRKWKGDTYRNIENSASKAARGAIKTADYVVNLDTMEFEPLQGLSRKEWNCTYLWGILLKDGSIIVVYSGMTTADLSKRLTDGIKRCQNELINEYGEKGIVPFRAFYMDFYTWVNGMTKDLGKPVEPVTDRQRKKGNGIDKKEMLLNAEKGFQHKVDCPLNVKNTGRNSKRPILSSKSFDKPVAVVPATRQKAQR